MMKLMVGLGNPGPTYAANRHNVGFMAVERIHDRWRGGPWRKKFQGEIAEATVGGERVMFLKPATFMNESGRAVAEAMRFYKIQPTDVVVVHDEIDLPPGKFRMKTGGGTGGHNGLKSVSAHCRDNFRRLRIGVGHPGRKEMVPTYVLHDFANADRGWLDPLLDAIADEASLLATGEDAAFASKVHNRLSGAKPVEQPLQGGREPRPAVSPGLQQRLANGPFSALAQFLRK